VFNFVYADDAPEKRDITKRLFEEIKENLYLPFTSVYVRDEIESASAERKEKMLDLLLDRNMKILQKSDEIVHLAELYISEGIIPNKYRTDALHIAAATVKNLDIIVSWNFEHIVKRKTVIMTEAVNLCNGYKKIDIHCPTEVIRNV